MWVEVLDDAHDEGTETMRSCSRTRSTPRSATPPPKGASATTTPMPQGWIARFGRTVADQVLDAVEDRMRAPRTPGTELTLAGNDASAATWTSRRWRNARPRSAWRRFETLRG